MPHPIVGIVMGSDSDWPIMKTCAETLKKFGVPHEAKVLSAHRTPDAALDYAEGAADRGMKVLIGAAGGAAQQAYGTNEQDPFGGSVSRPATPMIRIRSLFIPVSGRCPRQSQPPRRLAHNTPRPPTA